MPPGWGSSHGPDYRKDEGYTFSHVDTEHYFLITEMVNWKYSHVTGLWFQLLEVHQEYLRIDWRNDINAFTFIILDQPNCDLS